jgi:hypothetical protein
MKFFHLSDLHLGKRDNDFYISDYNYGVSSALGGLTFAVNSWTRVYVYLKGDYTFSNNVVVGTLFYDYEDNFGLDHGDLEDKIGGIKYGNLPIFGSGFKAWYILQHDKRWNGAHKPFHTKVSLQMNATTKVFS